MPLLLAPEGKTMKIMRVAADPKLCRRLQDLGIISGAEITVLSDAAGIIIVRIHESRVALDRGVARAILVA